MNRKELVEKMFKAYGDRGRVQAVCNIHDCMDAALSVAIEELLESADPDETWVWHEKFGIPELDVVNVIAAYRASRRAKLERAKTPEERVTVERATESGWSVRLDGVTQFWQVGRPHAETYRLGLIQQLKGSA